MSLFRKVFILSFTFISLYVQAQTFGFDPTGKLKEAPNPTINAGGTVYLKIDIDKDSLVSRWVTQRQKFSYLNAVLNEKVTTERENIYKELVGLYQFFLNKNWNKKPWECNVWENYQKANCIDTGKLRAFIDANKHLATQTVGHESCGNLCNCKWAMTQLQNLIKAQKRLNDIEQKEILIRELLCFSPQRKKLFNIIDTSSSEVRLLVPKDTLVRSIKGKVEPELFPDSIQFGYNLVKESLPVVKQNNSYAFLKTLKVPVNTSLFQFDVTADDGFRETVLNWHNKTAEFLNPDYVLLMDSIVKNSRRTYNSLLPAYHAKCDSACTPQLKRDLRILYDTLKIFDSVWCYANPIGRWLAQWMWYSAGDFKLNYLSFTDPNLLKGNPLNDTQKELLAQLKETKQRIDELKKCLSCNIKSLDTLSLLQKELYEIDSTIKSLNPEKDLSDNQAKWKAFLEQSKVLHSLTIPIYSSSQKRYIVYHNASRRFERYPDSKVILPDDRIVYYGFYNAKEKDTSSGGIPHSRNNRFVQRHSEIYSGTHQCYNWTRFSCCFAESLHRIDRDIS